MTTTSYQHPCAEWNPYPYPRWFSDLGVWHRHVRKCKTCALWGKP